MKKLFQFLTGTVAGILLSAGLAFGAIYGGIVAHNHSGGSSGGATLQSTTLNNPVLNGASYSGGFSPSSDISFDIGTSTNRWRNVFTVGIDTGTASSMLLNTGNGNSQVRITQGSTTGSANFWSLSGSNTGNGPQMVAAGVDTNIPAFFTSKGNGNFTLQFNGGGSLSAIAQNGTLTYNSAGSLSSNKACAASYVRITPNYCQLQATISTTAWTNATTCQNKTFGSLQVPADAKAVLLSFDWSASSNNAVALRTNQVNFFNDTSCTSSLAMVQDIFSVQEFVATPTTIIGQTKKEMIVPLCATNTICYTMSNAGGAGNASIGSYHAAGYFD